ncbi:MAG: hypothetical protein ACJAX1_002271 [Neolewinella sp.]|jgi:hypothetical protein
MVFCCSTTRELGLKDLDGDRDYAKTPNLGVPK